MTATVRSVLVNVAQTTLPVDSVPVAESTPPPPDDGSRALLASICAVMPSERSASGGLQAEPLPELSAAARSAPIAVSCTPDSADSARAAVVTDDVACGCHALSDSGSGITPRVCRVNRVPPHGEALPASPLPIHRERLALNRACCGYTLRGRCSS